MFAFYRRTHDSSHCNNGKIFMSQASAAIDHNEKIIFIGKILALEGIELEKYEHAICLKSFHFTRLKCSFGNKFLCIFCKLEKITEIHSNFIIAFFYNNS